MCNENGEEVMDHQERANAISQSFIDVDEHRMGGAALSIAAKTDLVKEEQIRRMVERGLM